MIRRIVAPLLLLAATPALADVRTGVALWAKGDYQGAVAEWKAPAAAGDADAQFNLGQAYRLGQGVPKDPAQAEALFAQSAAKNHGKAMAALGLMLYQKGDRAGAMPWLTKAAALGDPRAQYIVATSLFNGDDLPKDWTRAYAMMSRSAAAGLQPATLSLAQMERYLSAKEKSQGALLAKTLAGAERLSPAARRQLATRKGTRAADPVATKDAPSEVAVADKTTPKKPAGKKADTKTADAEKTDKAEKPEPKKAEAKAKAPAGKWKVQLGAFGGEAAAKRHWDKLSDVGGLSGLKPAYVARGGVVRLQLSGLADKDAAAKACKAAAKAGSGCFPVAP